MTKKRIVLLAALFLLSGCGNVGLPADASDSPGVKGESQADDDGESPGEAALETEESSEAAESGSVEPIRETVPSESHAIVFTRIYQINTYFLSYLNF